MIERIELPAGGDCCCEKHAKDNSFGIKSKPHTTPSAKELRRQLLSETAIRNWNCVCEHVDIKIFFLSFTIIRSVNVVRAEQKQASAGMIEWSPPKHTKKKSPSLARSVP